MKINVISESAFTVQGHGVHSAFTDMVDALRKYTRHDVMANTNRVADVVHIHTIGFYAVQKLLFGRGEKVVSAHVTPDSFVGSLAGANYWHPLAGVYLRWFYNRADAVCAVSQDVVVVLKQLGVRKPIFLLPNTIDTATYKPSAEVRAKVRRKHGIAEDAFVVLGNGQVQPRKRVDAFLAVARQLPEVTFVWVGGMPFKRLAADAGEMEAEMKNRPPNVIFTGLVDRQTSDSYYQAADLFFLPSKQETFGIVIVEAAAAGLPILLRDLPQYRDTFGEGYERGNDASFAELVKRFASDKRYREQWAERSKLIAERYDAKAGVERLVKVYEGLLNAKRVEGKQKAEAR